MAKERGARAGVGRLLASGASNPFLVIRRNKRRTLGQEQ